MTTTTNTTDFTAAATRAMNKYGADVCKHAYELNSIYGEGPSTIAQYLGFGNVNAANAAINAGREMASK